MENKACTCKFKEGRFENPGTCAVHTGILAALASNEVLNYINLGWFLGNRA